MICACSTTRRRPLSQAPRSAAPGATAPRRRRAAGAGSRARVVAAGHADGGRHALRVRIRRHGDRPPAVHRLRGLRLVRADRPDGVRRADGQPRALADRPWRCPAPCMVLVGTLVSRDPWLGAAVMAVGHVHRPVRRRHQLADRPSLERGHPAARPGHRFPGNRRRHPGASGGIRHRSAGRRCSRSPCSGRCRPSTHCALRRSRPAARWRARLRRAPAGTRGDLAAGGRPRRSVAHSWQCRFARPA